MKKINKDSKAFNLVKAGANVGIGLTTGRAVGMLVQPLLPAEIDLAAKIGLNLITYSIGLATSRTVISEVEDMVDGFNETVDVINEEHDQTVY